MSSSAAERDARALAAIRSLKAENAKLEYARREPIAIVGVACRFPRSNGIREFWRLLAGGIDASSEVPKDRWDVDAYYDTDKTRPGRMTTRRGSFLDDVASFDARFFGISPREAAVMDPQHRILLEVAWDAVEDAGYTYEQLASLRTGAFVGLMNTDYTFQVVPLCESGPVEFVPYFSTGNMHYAAANRLSYAFDWNGPSITVDTACSSSLVSVHLACEALRSGRADAAVAAGIQLILAPGPHVYGSSLGALSPDGRCKAFDASADGYGRGEGCGVVVLRRLSDALANGDRIWGLIVGSAVNHVGRVSGLTVPNQAAQAAVIREAMDFAGVTPDEIGYVETHGTGTLLGDPIEIEGLRAVFGSRKTPCPIGSVKTNIGHLEAGAGIAGLIKVLLAMRHRLIPPSLHYTTPNPHIPFDALPLRVQTELGPWPESGGPLLAGVSSFGLAGTNAHVVIRQAPAADEPQVEDDRLQVLTLSAKTPAALRARAEAMAGHLQGEHEGTLQDVCYTTAARGEHHAHRLALLARSRESLVRDLIAFTRGEHGPDVVTGGQRSRGLAMVFTGQGPQWWGMGRELLASEPVFRETMERCDALVRTRSETRLLEELARDESSSRLGQTAVAQVALFSLQVSLVALLRSWGIEPDAVVGHSVGEIAAAHVAGVTSLESALELALVRGRIMQEATGLGRMISTDLTLDEAQRLVASCADSVSVAASNAPRATVLSGDARTLADLTERLRRDGRLVKDIGVDYAFHSPQMASFVGELERAVGDLPTKPGEIPFVSTVTGSIEPAEALGVRYWARQIRAPVLFAQAVQHLLEEGMDTFLEIGPHPVLGPAMAQTLDAAGARARVVASLRRDVPEREAMLRAAAALHCEGRRVLWSEQYARRGRVVSLPGYPWQRERHWLDLTTSGNAATRSPANVDLLSRHVRLFDDVDTHVWEATIDLESFDYLADHVVDGAVLLPGMFWVSWALAAGEAAFGGRFDGLADVSFVDVLALTEPTRVQLVLRRDGDRYAMTISSSRGVHARGAIVLGEEKELGKVPLEAVRSRCVETTGREELYARIAQTGIAFGRRFQAYRRVHHEDGEALGEIDLWDGLRATHAPHPVLLDASFHPLVVAATRARSGTYLPTAVERVRARSGAANAAWTHVRVEVDDEGVLTSDVSFVAANGDVVVALSGVKTARVRTAKGELDRMLFDVAWRRVERSSTGSAVDRGVWIVFADDAGVGEAFAKRLRATSECAVVGKGSSYRRIERDRFEIDPSSPEDVARVLSDRLSHGDPCAGVVYLFALDAPVPETEASLDGALTATIVGALHVVQALLAANLAPRLWLVTRGASPIDASRRLAVEQSPLWGFGATLRNELPQLRATLVDLDPASGAPADELFHEVLGADEEDRVALREGERLAARLVPHVPRPRRPEPSGVVTAPSEVAIEIDEASTSATGFVGRIAHVGRDVSGLEVGDHVIVFASSNVCDARRVTKLPPDLADAAAHALSAGHFTAEVALARGGLEEGEGVFAFPPGGLHADAARELAARRNARVVGAPEDADLVVVFGSDADVPRMLRLVRPLGRIVHVAERGSAAIAVEGNVSFTRICLDELARRFPAALAKHLVDAARALTSSRGFTAAAGETPPISSEGTYLVTGGLGALGVEVAKWMIQHGARDVVLVSRSERADTAETLASLAASGARVRVRTCDVADLAAVRALLREIDETMPPLRGIVHAAGALDDGIIANLDRARLVGPVARAKVHGAWNLHVATKGRSLDFFVLFSSAASVLGMPGQASYAAANAFLGALAAHRAALSLPAQAIAWGAWASVGMAAALGEDAHGKLSVEEGLALFSRLLGDESPSVVAVGEAQASARRLSRSPLLSELAGKSDGVEEDGGVQGILQASDDERPLRLRTFLTSRMARITRMSAASLDLGTPLSRLGLDSLMALEVRTLLERELGVTAPLGEVLTRSIDELVQLVDAKLETEEFVL